MQVLLQMLNFASVLASGLMMWKGLGLITNTESPIVVVLRCALLLPAYCSVRVLTPRIHLIVAPWSLHSTAATYSS